ncbi:hypothetical protein GW17_00040455 [Ensete ventricosum]|nr:hypothetical protein GW17_00040455 [Ensete ventricosum]
MPFAAGSSPANGRPPLRPAPLPRLAVGLAVGGNPLRASRCRLALASWPLAVAPTGWPDTTAVEEVVMVAIKCKHWQRVIAGGSDGDNVGVGSEQRWAVAMLLCVAREGYGGVVVVIATVRVEAIRKQRWECRCYCVWLKAGAIVEESVDTWAIDGRWGYQQ